MHPERNAPGSAGCGRRTIADVATAADRFVASTYALAGNAAWIDRGFIRTEQEWLATSASLGRALFPGLPGSTNCEYAVWCQAQG
jgi:hypothetical protein